MRTRPPINWTADIDLVDTIGGPNIGGVWMPTLILTDEHLLIECIGGGCEEHGTPYRRMLVMQLSDRQYIYKAYAVNGIRLRDGCVVAGNRQGLSVINLADGSASLKTWTGHGTKKNEGLKVLAVGPDNVVLAQHMQYTFVDLVLLDASGDQIRRWCFDLEGLTDVYCAMVTNDYFAFAKSGRIFAVQRKGQRTHTLRIGEANLLECIGPDQDGIARPHPKQYTARVHAIRVADNGELVIAVTRARDPNAYSLSYGEVEEIKWRPFA